MFNKKIKINNKEKLGLFFLPELRKNTPFNISFITRPLSLPSNQKNTKVIESYPKGSSPELGRDLTIRPKNIFRYPLPTPRQGAQAKVRSEVLISPKGTRKMEVIIKKGHHAVKKEMDIYKAIMRHKNFKKIKPLFSVPFYSEINNQIHFFYTRLQPMGDLEQYVNYIHTHLFDFQTYLFEQFQRLLDALIFLHHEIFIDQYGIPHRGIVHGDIKPDNILLTHNGDFLLTDFGCAHFFDRPIQQLGMVLYVPPELHSTINDHYKKSYQHSDKADIWSLGVTLLYLMTKKYPIDFKTTTEINSRRLATTGYVSYETESKVDQKVDFLQDSMAGYLIRKKWGHDYYQTQLCQAAKIAKEELENLLDFPLSENITDSFRTKILMDVARMMLLPVEERPTAKTLKIKMETLIGYFQKDKRSIPHFFIRQRLTKKDTLLPIKGQNTISPYGTL